MTDEDRFWSHVVKGPAEDDCWIWIGAVGDDGYGRFWTRTPTGAQRTMRPQRFLWRALTGVDLPPEVLLRHRCDIGMCVHVDVDPARSHLQRGDQRDNMIDRARRGRNANGFTVEKFRTLPRAERARRSRELRDTVRAHGWDPDAIARALAGAGDGAVPLF